MLESNVVNILIPEENKCGEESWNQQTIKSVEIPNFMRARIVLLSVYLVCTMRINLYIY